MAKDKLEEKRYKEEGRKRIFERQQKRKSKWTNKVNRYGRGSSKCDFCGGYQSWCSTCQVWSSNCCIEYGTCQCS